MKRGAAGDPIVVVRLVWSHRFYWRPRIRRPDPMYRWGGWWLWFYIGSQRLPR